jgi:hypothetical protein
MAEAFILVGTFNTSTAQIEFDSPPHIGYPCALSGQARRGEAFRTPPGSKDSNGKEVSSGAAVSLSGYFYTRVVEPAKA